MGERGQYTARLLGEFFVIVFGVLAALAADSWNDARLDRIDEREYLVRLGSSVRADTANFAAILQWMDRKERGLRRIDGLLSSNSAAFDPDTVLADLTAAPNYGWNVGPLTGTATFEDLRSSGQLGLIRNRDLRAQIIQYYELADGEDRRIEARRTPYPLVSYGLIPFGRGPGEQDEYASASDVGALLDSLRHSELPRHILAETNRASFVRGSITELRDRAVLLLTALEQELRNGG